MPNVCETCRHCTEETIGTIGYLVCQKHGYIVDYVVDEDAFCDHWEPDRFLFKRKRHLEDSV